MSCRCVFSMLAVCTIASCGGGKPSTPPPVPPEHVTATADPGQVTITWELVPGAHSYNIYFSIESGVTKTTGTRVADAATPTIVTDLESGKKYFFVVTTVNSMGESPESGEVSAILPVEYLAIGDSITYGTGDDLLDDGTGYVPILGNLLVAAKGIPYRIVNIGVPGLTSEGGAECISNVLANFPCADGCLVLYGTNDANNPPVPSGVGTMPGQPGYEGSYKENMQRIITAIVSCGKTPFLAKVPYNTLSSSFNDSSIREYNVVIDELVSANGIETEPPDFYAWFQSHPDELGDALHPNGAGYWSMANLWCNALVTLPP